MDDKIHPKDGWKIFIIGSILFWSLFAFAYWLWTHRWDSLIEQGVKAKAVIRRDMPPEFYPPDYTYYVNGVKYNRVFGGRKSHNRCSFNHGDTITILYDPDDPEDSYPACELLDEYKIEAAWLIK